MMMATPISRLTYGAWLDKLAEQGRTDEFGMVAAAWRAAKDHGRPKLSAVKSVNAWLSEHPPPGGVVNLQQTLHQLERAYHDAGGLPEQVAPGMPVAPSIPPPGAYAPSGPGGNPMAPLTPTFQPPDPSQGVPAGQGIAWRPPEYQQPAPPAEAYETGSVPGQPAALVSAGQEPAQQQGVPEHPFQVIMLAVARLSAEVNAKIDAYWQAMAPLVQLAAEAGVVNAALDASQLAQAQPSAAQQRALEIAQQQGWQPGPAFTEQPEPEPEPAVMTGQAFYRNAVPPNFAQMAAEVITEDEDAAQ